MNVRTHVVFGFKTGELCKELVKRFTADVGQDVETTCEIQLHILQNFVTEGGRKSMGNVTFMCCHFQQLQVKLKDKWYS